MTRTATPAASEVDLWRYQTRMTRDVVAANTGGLSHQDSMAQPNPGGNRLNWVFGHLVWAYNGFLPLLGQEQVMDDALLKRYARGERPMEDPAEAIDFERLRAAWAEAVKRVDQGLAGLTPDVLDRPAPSSPTNNPNETIRSLITTVMFHQAYHAGQTGVLRRIAGKEGAIR